MKSSPITPSISRKARVPALIAALSLGAFASIPAYAADPGAPTIGQRADDAGRALSDTASRAADKLTGTTQPSGVTVSESEGKALKKAMADITDAAVTKGGFDNIVSRLTDADRTRIGKDKNLKWDDLDQAAAQLQQDFKDKYSQAFKIKDPVDAFAGIPIFTGDLPDARVANSGDANLGNNAQPAGATQAPVNNPDNSQANRVNDNLATAYLAAQNDLPSLNVHFSNEGTLTRSWKVDLPQQFSAQQLHDNLLRHLQALHDNRSTWPADANAAYRMITHHVFVALYNADSPMMQTPGTGNASGTGMNNGTVK